MIDRDKKELCQNIGTLGLLASLAATAVFGVKGCSDAQYEKVRSGYSQAGEQIDSVFTKSFPDEVLGNGINEDVSSPIAALEESQRILDSFGTILQIKHPMKGREYPFINYSNWAIDSGDYLGFENLRDNERYKTAAKTAQLVRKDMADQLEECADTIAKLAIDANQNNDPLARDYASALAPRLHILAKRMREGQLMVNYNVLNTTSKFGEFAELTGRTKHYDEALAEVKALLEYLKQKENTDITN